MKVALSRRRFLVGVSIITATAPCSGCGTLLYPERIGQTRGQIDWRIAALDGAGLLLFFVPGVIAFAVDFYNGTIFLPPEEYIANEKTDGELRSVKVPREELDQNRIEKVVSEQTGKTLSLTPGKFHAVKLSNINQFWLKVRTLGRGEKASLT